MSHAHTNGHVYAPSHGHVMDMDTQTILGNGTVLGDGHVSVCSGEPNKLSDKSRYLLPPRPPRVIVTKP